MNRRTGVIIMSSCLLAAILITIIATTVPYRITTPDIQVKVKPANTTQFVPIPTTTSKPDPCPLLSQSLKIDAKTTLYTCNKTSIQLAIAGTRTVTFTLKQLIHMQDKKELIYQRMGLFEFDNVFLQVGRPKRVVIGRAGEKGIALTADQFQKLMGWTLSGAQ